MAGEKRKSSGKSKTGNGGRSRGGGTAGSRWSNIPPAPPSPGASAGPSASRARRGPSRAARSRARRTCCSSCSTTPASANSAAIGSPIRTPNLDRLAKNGLLYCNMHTTALCSPTRSCILTGRNHHSQRHVVHHRRARKAIPARTASSRSRTASCPRSCSAHGYNTYARRQVAPDAGGADRAPPGPYDRWPLGRGFERYYGFLGGDTHQYYPDLVYDNHQVEPPKTPEQGYHLTDDLVDKAIEFIADSKQVAPDKPFFLYFAPGAQHAPHQVPKEWADKYKGKFDDGWDAYREQVFAAPEGARASCRRTPSCRATIRTCRTGTTLSGGRAQAVRAHDGGVRRLRRAHRPSHRPAARLPGGDGRARQHADHGDLRQRRERRRRTARLGQREQVLQQRSRVDRREPRGARRTRRARSTSTTIRGAGRSPATRRSGAGSARPIAAA